MGAVTGETALYPCLQEKKEGKKTMSTKDVSCLAAPWVNSEPCGGVVVLPGALTHHVCVWLVPSPWQHWGGGREPGSAFTQLVPKQYGQAPQRSCPKPTCHSETAPKGWRYRSQHRGEALPAFLQSCFFLSSLHSCRNLSTGLAVSSCLPGRSTLAPSARAVLVPLTGSVVTLIKLHFVTAPFVC